MDKPHTVRSLKVYQRAMDLVETTYRVCEVFPKDERFELSSQIRRAAVSVPANIAEGYGRWNMKELVRFLAIANGSLRELQTHFEIAKRLGYIQETRLTSLHRETDEIAAMIYALRARLSLRIEKNGS